MEHTAHKPSPWILVPGTILILAGFPLDGLIGAAASLLGAALNLSWAIRTKRATR